MKQTPKASMTLRLPVDIYTRLVTQANTEGVSMNALVLQALDNQLPQLPPSKSDV